VKKNQETGTNIVPENRRSWGGNKKKNGKKEKITRDKGANIPRG